MKLIIVLSFLLVVNVGCKDLMKSFLTVDKKADEAELPSQQPESPVKKTLAIDMQMHSGGIQASGTSSSTEMKTQYYKNQSTSSGLSMTMSLSSQGSAN